MRRVIAGFFAAVVAAGGVLIVEAAPAAAGCAKVNHWYGKCIIEVTDPADPPSAGAEPADPVGNDTGRGGNGKPKCVNQTTDKNVPCSDGQGFWSNANQCYVEAMDPPPPRGDPIWAGNTTGAIYQCGPGGGAIRGGGFLFWAGAPPAGPAAPPDPGALAQQVVESMQLHAIGIGIVPEPGTSSVGLIGMPTWMWVAQPSATTWGPISRSASAGGVTVAVTAKVDRVEWDMGDGQVVTCTTPGTPYADHYGKSNSPDCGHRYTRTSVGESGDAYTVSATSYWVIDWTGGGQTGTINMDFTDSTQIRVGEMQVLVTN